MALTKQLNSLRKDTEEFKVCLAHTHTHTHTHARMHAHTQVIQAIVFLFQQVKRKIRDKYLQIQEVIYIKIPTFVRIVILQVTPQDKEYQTKKKRFLLLHYKLAHVKKMVVEYDLLHEHSNDSLS